MEVTIYCLNTPLAGEHHSCVLLRLCVGEVGNVGLAWRQESGSKDDQHEAGSDGLSTQVHATGTGHHENTVAPEHHSSV